MNFFLRLTLRNRLTYLSHMKSLSGVAIVLMCLVYFLVLTLLVDYEENFLEYLGDMIVAFVIVLLFLRILQYFRK